MRVATPLLSSVAEPMVKRLQVKLTLPVGVMLPKGATVAVKVTFCP
jgi:invasion protein IalB